MNVRFKDGLQARRFFGFLSLGFHDLFIDSFCRHALRAPVASSAPIDICSRSRAGFFHCSSKCVQPGIATWATVKMQ